MDLGLRQECGIVNAAISRLRHARAALSYLHASGQAGLRPCQFRAILVPLVHAGGLGSR